MKIPTLGQSLKQSEKILLTFLVLLCLWMGFYVGKAFYFDYSQIIPVSGGTYVEGAVGEVGTLNPLLVQQGSITHDMTQLIFSGLTKYDPKTAGIVPDLANFTLSSNEKEYTFVIKENALWHDGQPVTSDDVIFTYNTVIGNPAFKGAILTYNDYTGIKVSKIDQRTVQFLLEKPDSFFLVKTMVGLLPEHLLRDQSVESLDLAIFNLMPVGSGPYKFITQNTLTDYDEYNLTAFDGYYGGPLSIQNISFRVFPTLEDLKKNLKLLDGVRNIPAELKGEIEKIEKFSLVPYHLPQYVAVFLNNESDLLKDSKVRLALQLGTDKEQITEALGQDKIIDSPLLEIEQEDWRLLYDVTKANGALFDTQWKIPNKEAIQQELKAAETSAEATQVTGTEAISYINNPNGGQDWTTAQSAFNITGTAPEGIERIEIKGYTLQEFKLGSKTWSFRVDAEAYQNLFPGENVYEVVGYTPEGEKKTLDSITISYITKQDLTEEEKEAIFLQNQSAPPLPTRVNDKGESLALTLITPEKPESYQEIARILEQQWKKIGVGVQIQVLDLNTFQNRLNARDYDLLIFGQNLGYNLDAYPYWHSGQANTKEKQGGLNLSQFKDFVADSLLEKARQESKEEDRVKTLKELQGIITTQVPALFLYSPVNYFALSNKVQNASFENLATVTDRLVGIQGWSAQVERQWVEGAGVWTFFVWMFDQL